MGNRKLRGFRRTGKRPSGAGGSRASTPHRRPVMRRVARWTAAGVVAILVLAVLGAYWKYRSVWNSIHRVTVTDLGHRPQKYTSALNILVFGSDNRSKLSLRQERLLHVGRNTENSTDTIMIVHISPGHRRVTVMDIPRDTVVPAYECPKGPGWPGQQANPNAFERINVLLAVGGPGCLWKTIEQQTGIHIDHFIELGLLGFVHVINDLGGVNVCVPFNVNDPLSGLRLHKGEHHINGIMALKFWRTREAIGTGSDLQRIQRDQFLMAQILQAVLHGGLLSSPIRLLSVVSDTAKAMTTDSGLSQSDMLAIAQSFRGLSSRSVQFVTAPNIPYPADPAEVEFAQPQAHDLFMAIAHDRKLPRAARSKGGTHPVVTAASPSQVKVQVLNGSSIAGLAATTASKLTRRGFTVTGTGNAAAAAGAVAVVEYSTASQLPEVKALRKQVRGARAKMVPGLPAGTLDLIVGPGFTGLKPAHAATPSPSGVAGLSKTYGGITGSASCKSDGRAFAGPLSP